LINSRAEGNYVIYLQQMVNDELSRTYYQLADSMALHDSQISILAHDLKNPAFRAQRENLSQLQVHRLKLK